MIKCMLIVALLFIVDAYEIANPGCIDECGGVKIPFPFGLEGSKCYLNDLRYMINGTTFAIKCDNTTNPSTPFILDLYGSYNKLLSINIEDHTFRFFTKAAFECYTINMSDIYGSSIPISTLNNTYSLPYFYPFNISSTRNGFIAVGCDTTARVGSIEASGDSIGCMTSCQSLESVSSRNGACSGPGCCQSSIFNTMQRPTISVGNVYKHWPAVYFSECSYSFIVELGSYEFSNDNLIVSAQDFDKIQFPVVYDWVVPFGKSCIDAKKYGNGAYIC